MNAVIAALWQDETPYAFGAALVLAALVYRFMATGGVTVRRSLLFLGFWAGLDVAAAIFSVLQQPGVADGLHQAACSASGWC